MSGSKAISSGGWSDFVTVFSGGDGSICAVTVSGDLLWHAADAAGVSRPQAVGHGGWNGFHAVFSGGSGVI